MERRYINIDNPLPGLLVAIAIFAIDWVDEPRQLRKSPDQSSSLPAEARPGLIKPG